MWAKSIGKLNIHFNGGRHQASGTLDYFEDNLNFFIGLSQECGLDLPIWITEFGTYSGSPPGKPYQSEVFQATWYIEYSLFAMARGVTKITPDLIEYCYDCTPLIHADDIRNGGGISSQQVDTYTATLAYYVHKLLRFILADRAGIEELKKATYEEGRYRIIKKDGGDFYVAWGSGRFDELEGDVTVIDIYGNISVMDAGSITLSPDAPLIITKREVQQ